MDAWLSCLRTGAGADTEAGGVSRECVFYTHLCPSSQLSLEKGIAFTSAESIINTRAQVSPENIALGGKSDRHEYRPLTEGGEVQASTLRCWEGGQGRALGPGGQASSGCQRQAFAGIM